MLETKDMWFVAWLMGKGIDPDDFIKDKKMTTFQYSIDKEEFKKLKREYSKSEIAKQRMRLNIVKNMIE